MNYQQIKLIYPVMAAFVIAVMTGCGNGDPTANSEGKWFDGGNVQQAYKAQIRSDALSAGEQPFDADTSCAAILPMAQKSLSDSSGTGTLVQLMYKTCNDVWLKFQTEVRCEADRLQVLCK